MRWAALVHDIGKPVTAADGHFYGHEIVGAELAGDLLRRWHAPRETIDEVTHLVRHHMFAYEAAWSDAAVRRFIAKVGPARLDDLFALREADNVGSGVPADAGGLDDAPRAGRRASSPRTSRSTERAWRSTATTSSASSAWPPGPLVGRILDALLERVMNDPRLNRPATLLALARELASTMSEGTPANGRPTPGPSREAG